MRQAASQDSTVPNARWPPWVGYVVAVVLETAVTAFASAVQTAVPGVSIRTPEVIAIGAVAYYFGAGPAVLAFVLGIVEWVLFLSHPYTLSWPPSGSPGWIVMYSLALTTAIAGVAMWEFRKSTQRSSRLAIDLRNALRREEFFSRLLQRALLPGNPSIGDDYRVHAGYVPLYASREIGGDFYDIFAKTDDVAVMLIGDVSGKGLEAASLAATTRVTVHAFIHDTSSPAEALARANSVLCSGLVPPNSFVTVLLAILHRPSGRFTYSSAGHPPPVIARADGRIDVLELAHQMPLGISGTGLSAQSYNHLEPGDRLVLYTDGISEARRVGQMYDVDGIKRTLEASRDLPIAELVDKVITDATEWADRGLNDDAVVAIVERQPGP